MIVVAITGFIAACGNVILSWLVDRKASRSFQAQWAWLQAAAFAARLAVIFLGAAVWWRRSGQAKDVAVFVVTAAVAQMVGQIWLLSKDNHA